MGSKEIDVFPAAGLGKGGDVFDAGTLVELASEQPLIQENQDPERPILFDPVEVGDVGEVFPDEGVNGDGDEEMIEDELADYSPSHAGDEDGPVIEGDGDGDMEVDWLVNHLWSLFSKDLNLELLPRKFQSRSTSSLGERNHLSSPTACVGRDLRRTFEARPSLSVHAIRVGGVRSLWCRGRNQ